MHNDTQVEVDKHDKSVSSMRSLKDQERVCF